MEEKQHPRERDSPMEDNGLRRKENERLERMAARKRWNIPDRIKDKVLNTIEAALDDKKEPGRALKAGRLLSVLEGQNQKDEHIELLNHGNDNPEELDAAINSELARMADGEEAGPAAPSSPKEQP